MPDRLAQLAALGDHHRLAVVDELARGDLSPAELAARTGLATNLLAHHLRVLEEARIVARRRSDGDRRRSYLSLVWSPLVSAVASGAIGAPSARVVFVCTGNAGRSPVAAALLAAQGVRTASAGTAPVRRLHPAALSVLARRGLDPLAPAPVALADIHRRGDLVITVCDRAHESGAGDLHWSVPSAGANPTPDAYARIVDLLVPRVRRLAEALVHDPS